MTSVAREYDDSRLSARLTLLMGLAMFEVVDGLLSPENLRTSLLAVSYAFALGVMALGTLTFALQRLRSYLNPETPMPPLLSGPVWHKARLFTDPWYQVPALYCVFVLLVQLCLDLAAEPPRSDPAVRLLVSVAVMTVVLPFSISRRVRLELEEQEEEGDGQPAAGRTAAAAFRDPWFTVPGAILASVHIARWGVEIIEEDPSSAAASWLPLAPLLVVAFAAIMPLMDQYRRRRKEA